MVQFGTGGWRAIIGDEFTRANLELLAEGFVRKLIAEKKEKDGIVIGYDRRFLSKESAIWICQVFAGHDIPIWFVNRSSPTPLIMYHVMTMGYPYGMMVTASHNPAIYNGVKVFTAGGRDADEKQTADIEFYIRQVEKEVKNGYQIPTKEYEKAVEEKLILTCNPMNEYLDNILATVDLKKIRDRKLRVALDPMYGVSYAALQTILSTMRCDIEIIHGRHDTLFGGKLPAPTAETLRGLQTTVLDRGMDIGIATDGDADRLGVIDDTGRFLHPNDILVLLYYYLLKYKGWRGDAVRNIATTHTLDKVAESFGQHCHEVPVGFKHISAKMQETDAIIGGESSGGLTVKGHINGKDGIYAASLLIEMIAVTGKTLGEISKEIESIYGSTYMEETNFRFSKEDKESIYETLMVKKQLPDKDAIGFEIDHVSYEDGCKVYFKNGGWIVARFSGTEPLIRIFCEMENRSDAVRVCEVFRSFLGL